MSYVLTPYGKTRRALVGVPWRDLSDEEYTAACELYPGIEDRGYFEQVAEQPNGNPKPRREGNIDVYDTPEVKNG